MKKKIVRVISCVLGALFILISIEVLSMMLYPNNNITKNWVNFYAQDKNSINTLVMGSSHAYASFDVDYLTEKIGDKYYVLASNSQTVTQSYYNLKEVLKYQTPKRVILEAYGINAENNWQGDDSIEFDKDWKKESNIDGMRWGIPKIEAITNQYTPANWAYAALKIARCHGNWKNVAVILNNYQFYQQEVKNYSCFIPSESSMSEETQNRYSAMRHNTNAFEPSDVNVEHFHKLAELCRENDIEMLVVMAPSYDEYIRHINYESRYQTISALAEEEGVTYLDCNMHYDEIGLVATDFEDAFNAYHHLNAKGAEKVTEFLLKQLV